MAETYRRIRRAVTKQEQDRGQWAEPTQVIISVDFEGVGSETTDVTFGIVFEGPPVYSWGVELQQDETLTPNDFPHVTSGVASWVTKEATTDVRASLLYLGATIWYRSASNRSYRTRLRTSFEGIAFKNPQHFQESS